MVSSEEKIYKHFIGYTDDGYKIKPFSEILPKISAHTKSYDSETRWMYFLIEDDKLLKNIMIFIIK